MKRTPKTATANRLTWQQLTSLYPDSWVLLVNPDVPASGYAVRSGDFVYKHKRQEKVIEKARTLPTGSFIAIKYTGNVSLPANTVVCL
jgi:hypothetical protein